MEELTEKPKSLCQAVGIDEKWELSRDRVQLVEKIAQGNFGKVYRGLLRGVGKDEKNMPVAVKTQRETQEVTPVMKVCGLFFSPAIIDMCRIDCMRCNVSNRNASKLVFVVSF